ncbi:MAG: LPS export ABC transporter periplasmic protein LptC, partial [Pseudomonadota bacterium]
MTSTPVTRPKSVAPPPLGDVAHARPDASGARRHNGPRPTAVKAARRNTTVVRTLRLMLPGLSVGLIGFYAFGLVQNLGLASTERANAPKFTFDGPIISRSGLGMVAPRYEGFNKDGSRYVVKAKRAVTDLRVKGPVKLEAIDGRLFQIDQSVVRLEATRGTFNQTSNMLTLRDGILIRSSEGMTARLVSADVNPKSGKIKTAEPVEVQLPTGVIVSRAMDIDQKKRVITFKDGVRATLKPSDRSVSLGGADTLQNLQLSGSAADGRRAQPIVISARSLKIEDGSKRATFIGPVHAAQGATKLTADQLLIDYTVAAPPAGQQANGTEPPASKDNPLGAAAGGTGQLKALVASGNVVIVEGGRTTHAPRVEFEPDSGVAVLSGGVRIDEADGRKVRAAEATLDQKAQTAKLTGGVTIRQGNGQSVRATTASLDQKAQRATLIGDVRISGGNNQGAVAARADLDQAAQRAVLTGRVRVTQGRNTLSGDRLVADQARGTLSLTGTRNGRISARFFREQASTG